MKRSETLALAQRLMSSCSTPHSSGNSERIPLPPSVARRSATWPMAGIAENPENPSETPQFSPKQLCDKEADRLVALFASARPRHVPQNCLASTTASDSLLSFVTNPH